MAEPKKNDTEKVVQTGMGLSLKTANPDAFPIAYDSDVWDTVEQGSELADVMGAPGQYDQHTINEALATNAGGGGSAEQFQFAELPTPTAELNGKVFQLIPGDASQEWQSAFFEQQGMYSIECGNGKWLAGSDTGKIYEYVNEQWVLLYEIDAIIKDIKFQNDKWIIWAEGTEYGAYIIDNNGLQKIYENYVNGIACGNGEIYIAGRDGVNKVDNDNQCILEISSQPRDICFTDNTFYVGIINNGTYKKDNGQWVKITNTWGKKYCYNNGVLAFAGRLSGVVLKDSNGEQTILVQVNDPKFIISINGYFVTAILKNLYFFTNSEDIVTIAFAEEIRGIGIGNDTLYVGTAHYLYRMENGEFVKENNINNNVEQIKYNNDQLFVGGRQYIYKLDFQTNFTEQWYQCKGSEWLPIPRTADSVEQNVTTPALTNIVGSGIKKQSEINESLASAVGDVDLSSCEKIANKVTSINAQSTDTQYPSAKAVFDALANIDLSALEQIANKVTSINAQSTDTQYPSAKLLYDKLQALATIFAPIVHQHAIADLTNPGALFTQFALNNGILNLTIGGQLRSITIPTGNTPSGDPLHYVYVKLGCVYNTTTGLWTYRDLTDLTTEDIQNAYTFTANDRNQFNKTALYRNQINVRFNFSFDAQFQENQLISTDRLFQNNHNIEYVYFQPASINLNSSAGEMTIPQSSVFMCADCTKLIAVRNILKNSGNSFYIETASTNKNSFNGCPNLVELRIKQLDYTYTDNRALSFSFNKSLSLESIAYMIVNASPTRAFTILFHADAYARAQADTTQYTYNGNTYTGILALASAKNITMASA